jgi:hypothetical protein
MEPTRRRVLAGLLAATSAVWVRDAVADSKPTITVHKSPT